MNEAMETYSKKIDPFDPIYNQPRKNNRFMQMNKDCEYFRVPCESSKTGYKVQSVYKGIYYQSDEKAEDKKKHHMHFILLYFLAISAFFIGSLLPYHYNRVWYVGMIEFIILVSFSYVLVVFITHLFTDLKMTEYIFKTTISNRLKGCKFTYFMLFICLIAITIDVIFEMSRGNVILGQFAGIMVLFVSAKIMNELWKLENSVVYRSWISKDTIDDFR